MSAAECLARSAASSIVINLLFLFFQYELLNGVFGLVYKNSFVVGKEKE